MPTQKGRELFARIAPESEALYVKMEDNFGKNRMQALYELLSAFYTTLNCARDR
jgi:hypothetical protein